MKAVNENLKGRWNQGLAKATVLKALIAMTLCSPLGALAIDRYLNANPGYVLQFICQKLE